MGLIMLAVGCLMCPPNANRHANVLERMRSMWTQSEGPRRSVYQSLIVSFCLSNTDTWNLVIMGILLGHHEVEYTSEPRVRRKELDIPRKVSAS